MSPLFFNMYKGGVTKEVKMGMGRIGMKFLEEGREWILPGLLHAENWIFCGVAEEDLKVMMRRFVEVCRRRGVKVNENKNKVMVIGGEEEDYNGETERTSSTEKDMLCLLRGREQSRMEIIMSSICESR